MLSLPLRHLPRDELERAAQGLVLLQMSVKKQDRLGSCKV